VVGSTGVRAEALSWGWWYEVNYATQQSACRT